MKKTPRCARFGLEIEDFDVRGIDDRTFAELLADLETYGFLLFRRQMLSDKDLLAFSQRFGRLEEPARTICHSPDSRYIAYLTNLQTAEGKPLGFGGNHTDYWHSDQEYRLNPATLASLFCIVPSPVGGATSFASTLTANLNLPAGFVDELRELRVTYLAAATHDNVDRIEVSHPLILKSPVSGKESVYVSENTKRITGVDEARSEALKQQLLKAVLDPDNVYSHPWEMGDFIVYDNTQLVHRRDQFEGIRWLKATKIFAPEGKFAVPVGVRYEEASYAHS